MKNISNIFITLSIILLFIGVSLSSGISVDMDSTTVEDCGCNEVDNEHLQFLEKQLNRLEVYRKFLLVLNKYNFEFKEISEKISDFINLYGFWEDFCDAISNLAQSI